MRRIIGAACAVLIVAALSGCAALRTTSDLATTDVGAGTVAQARNSIYAIENGYAAALVVAQAYVNLPPCELPRAPDICSSSPVVKQLVKARGAVSATIANAHEVIANAKGTSSALSTAVSAAQAAYESYKAIMVQYNVK